MIDAGVHIGEIFLEKYRVDSILGHGGMGIVALCTHLALNERVAIKMLRKDVLGDADAVERFMREAQAASKLRSEYVARVTDVGRSASNVPYMVMEYLEGHDLCDLLEERGSLSVPWAVELTLQACEALAEAHSIGIVHRDVKPANLFVTWRPDGSALVKVLDFGISKTQHTSTMQLTQTQSLLGTPAYMSPEQTRSARLVDARTDIWSLGTVLYEALEGRRPFEAESFSEMCVKVATEAPGPMVNTPPALQQVVLRCLEKAPEQRYASMAELGRDLVVFSHDPHQAQVLADRMARTLRRGQVGDGDQRTSGAHPRLSAERRAELSGGLSSPAIPALLVPVPPPTGSGVPAIPAGAPVRISAASDAEPSLSATYAVARPKQRYGVVIVAAAIAAAALGVVISLARSTPAHPTEPPQILTPAKPIAAEPPGDHAVADPAAGSGNPAGSAASPIVQPAVVRPAEPPPALPGPRRVKPPKPVEPAVELKPASTAPCKTEDPFGGPHGKQSAPCTPATPAVAPASK
ncbi:MAG: protein kinase [Kofleriaceae bacterium]